MIEHIQTMRKSNPKIFEIIRFLFVGGVATIIDFLVMAYVIYLPNKGSVSLSEVITSNFQPESWLVILATAIGFLVGLVFNYIFSILYVYEGDNNYAKTKKGFILFLFLSAIGLAIQTLGMFLGYTLLGINEWIVKIVLVIVVLAFNYITRKIFIFNKGKTPNTQLENQETITKKSIDKKSLLFNLGFIVSSMALTKLLYVDIWNNALWGYLYACASGIIVAFFLFFITKNLIYKLELKSKPIFISSIILALLTIFTFVFYHSIELFPYDYIIMLALPSFAIFVYSNLLTNFAFKRIINFWQNLTKIEKTTFLSIFIIGIIASTIMFAFTNVFAVSVGVPWDAFVSFDTGYMALDKVFINIWESQNDLRHMFIGLCTLPFAIIPFFLSKILFFIPESFNLLMLYVQCLIGAYAIIKLNHFLKINDSTFKVLFLILFFLSAGTLFNMLTLEKFMFAIFYLVFFMTLEEENNPLKWLVLVGLIGILTTNAFLLIILIFREKQDLKKSITLLFDFIMLYVCILMVFGHFSILLDIPRSYKEISGFSTLKNNIGTIALIYQFFTFISTLFFFPKYQLEGMELIQTSPSTNIFFILGIIIFVLCIISFATNIKNKFARTCFYWQLLMIVLLFVLGWGSSRNEMFIYSSIFLWPTLSLLYIMFDKIPNRVLKISILSFVITIIAIYNIYCLIDVTSILSTPYPPLI